MTPVAPLRFQAAAGAFGLGLTAPIGSPFEEFRGGWWSFRTDPELARAWTRLPSALEVDYSQVLGIRAHVRVRMGLRRDISAWRRDDLALNLPLSIDEVDLNQPAFGYFRWEGAYLGATVGRFPIHWSTDRDFALALSQGVPYHNAAEALIKLPRVQYRFLVASLNPWLEGTPPGDSASTEYPVGSEQWRQRHWPVLPGVRNAHKRVYDQPIKTLIAHRLEGRAGWLAFGITETHVVGGKPPDLRDLNPAAVFHNDFHEGYSNNNVGVDAALALPAGFRVSAEWFLDDVNWSDKESLDGEGPTLFGWRASTGHVFRASGWRVSQRLHAVRTDPYLYGYLQPLNTYTSRIVLSSNDQRPEDPFFVDKYVVDYPLGYLRGGDALDFWYLAEAARGGWRASLTAGWLSRGEAGTGAPYEGYRPGMEGSPSGTPERELRVLASGSRRFPRGWEAQAGAGWIALWNEAHAEGRDSGGPRFSLGLAWIR